MQMHLPFRPSCSCCGQPCDTLCRQCGRYFCEHCLDQWSYCSEDCREARRRERERYQKRTDLPF
jgi:hypothetical protein